MASREMKVAIKIERDAQNFFFAKVLYGFLDSKEELKTVYAINDEELLNNIISLSSMALKNFPFSRTFGGTIIIRNTENKHCYFGKWATGTQSNNIITGTTSVVEFSEINCLIRIFSHIMKKEKMGEFCVQYNEKFLKEEEFLKLQEKMSVLTE